MIFVDRRGGIVYNYNKIILKEVGSTARTRHMIAAALLTAFSVFACSVAPVDRQQQLIDEMNARYGDKFTFAENAGGGTDFGEYLAIFVRSEKLPDDKIFAVHGSFDGKAENRDNYMAYLLRPEADSFMTDMASSVYGECRAFVKPDERSVLPPEITKDSSAEDMLRSTKVYCTVYLPPERDLSDKEEKLDEFFGRLKSSEIRCYLNVTYTGSEKVYSSLDGRTDLDSADKRAECRLGMDDDFNIVEKQWG